MDLQIYIFGPSEEGFLDIAPGTFLDLENLSDIFDEELSLGEYSLPGTALWTDNNRRLTGFAERVQNGKPRVPYFKCNVYYKNYPEIINGRLTILSKASSFSYKNGSFSFSIAGSKGMFGSVIKYKWLNQLKLGGSLNITSLFPGLFGAGIDTRMFATQHAKGQFPQLDFFEFAPVAIEGFFDSGRADYNYEFLAKDVVNYPVIDPGTNTWQFGRLSGTQALDANGQPITNPDGTPKIIYATAPVASGQPGYTDYRSVPFLKAKYVLKKVFEENGFTITGDFLTGTDFDDLFIFNQYGLEQYAANNYDFNRTITFANHVPPILIIDFLKGLFDFLNLFPVFKGTQVTLYNRVKEIKNRRVAAMSNMAASDFTSSPISVDTKNSNGTDIGYSLNYTWDSADQYYSDRVKDLATVTDKTYVGSVPTVTYLYNLNIGRQLLTSDIAYVESENMYYTVADATSNPIKWDAYSEELTPYVVADGTRNVSVNCSTLCQYVEQNITTGLMERKDYLGTKQQGSYINAKGVLVNNPFNRQLGALPGTALNSNGVNTTPLYNLRVFFIRKKIINGVLVPYTSNFNRDENNQRIAKYSLAWKGIDGLAAQHHAAWQDMRQNMEIVKCTYKCDKKVLATMASANCHEINGVLFVPYMVERTIPLQETMTVSLVPLQ